MRVIHYYREAKRPSGVTAIVRAWQQTAIRLGLEATVVHARGGAEWVPGGIAIRHFGSSRRFAVPAEFGWMSAADLVVLHEGWMMSNYVAALAARVRGKPYVVVPHGAYEPGAMQGVRLRRLWRWAEARYLAQAAAVHISFSGEAQLVRGISATAACQVVPMGFEPEWPAQQSRANGYIAWCGLYDSDKDGLDRLLYSLALLPAARRPRLALRGEDNKGGLRKIRHLAAELQLEESVDVQGPVCGDERRRFLMGANAFVCPSRWEAHGIDIIEAMAAGLPVLLSDSTQIAPLIKAKGAGQVVSFEEPMVVARALEVIGNRHDLRTPARRFVDDDLHWSTAAASYIEFISAITHSERRRA